jgi:hypothetical protein
VLLGALIIFTTDIPTYSKLQPPYYVRCWFYRPLQIFDVSDWFAVIFARFVTAPLLFQGQHFKDFAENDQEF